jgi:uncharacterized protein with LGFP repeats
MRNIIDKTYSMQTYKFTTMKRGTKNFCATLILLFFVYSASYADDPIREKYQKMGGEKSALGKPLMQDPGNAAHGGKYQQFKNGNIYWHPNTGAWAVHGKIMDKYGQAGGEKGNLGYPTSDVMETPNKKGKVCRFEGGSIYKSKKGKPHVVKEPILSTFGEHQFVQGKLGFPVSEELRSPTGTGRFQRFEGGNIYWSEEAGVHAVSGSILKKYGELKWENGRLGYPTSNELHTPDQSGRFQTFQRGNIYKSKEGTFEVYGEILRKWGRSGYEQGNLGYPVTGVINIEDQKFYDQGSIHPGKFVVFENGAIYWAEHVGAQTMDGKMFEIMVTFYVGPRGKDFYLMGIVVSHFGYPATDVIEDANGTIYMMLDNGGKILWHPDLMNNFQHIHSDGDVETIPW